MAGFPAPQPDQRVISTPGEPHLAHGHAPAWRAVVMLGWVGAVLGYSTIWAVSRQVGLPTWWLGPRSDPQPLAITAIPFALPVLMLIGVALGLRRIALYGVIAAVLSAPIALVDLEAQPGLAIAQIAVSLAALCASAAALLAGSRR